MIGRVMASGKVARPAVGAAKRPPVEICPCGSRGHGLAQGENWRDRMELDGRRNVDFQFVVMDRVRVDGWRTVHRWPVTVGIGSDQGNVRLSGWGVF